MHATCEPIAVTKSAAHPLESPPPLNPQMTRLFPTFVLMSRTVLSMKAVIFHEPEQPQTSRRKFARICPPCGVWLTSGWNWMPNTGRVRCFTAAIGQVSVVASGTKSADTDCTWSPWLIQAVDPGGQAGQRGFVAGAVGR